MGDRKIEFFGHFDDTHSVNFDQTVLRDTETGCMVAPFREAAIGQAKIGSCLDAEFTGQFKRVCNARCFE